MGVLQPPLLRLLGATCAKKSGKKKWFSPHNRKCFRCLFRAQLFRSFWFVLMMRLNVYQRCIFMNSVSTCTEIKPPSTIRSTNTQKQNENKVRNGRMVKCEEVVCIYLVKTTTVNRLPAMPMDTMHGIKIRWITYLVSFNVASLISFSYWNCAALWLLILCEMTTSANWMKRKRERDGKTENRKKNHKIHIFIVCLIEKNIRRNLLAMNEFECGRKTWSSAHFGGAPIDFKLESSHTHTLICSYYRYGFYVIW